MATIHVQLPSLLSAVVEGCLSFELHADSLCGALDVLQQDHPRLALHLFDERHHFRPHVLCFHNGRNTRWLDSLDVPLHEGDTLLFMQAVTGG